MEKVIRKRVGVTAPMVKELSAARSRLCITQ